jgi:hypothetical protein
MDNLNIEVGVIKVQLINIENKMKKANKKELKGQKST